MKIEEWLKRGKNLADHHVNGCEVDVGGQMS